MQHSEIGSPEPSRSSNRPWPRSWRQTPLSMSSESESGRDFSCTRLSRRSPTCHLRIMENSSPIKSSGSLTTPMSTESPFTRHLKATWQQSRKFFHIKFDIKSNLNLKIGILRPKLFRPRKNLVPNNTVWIQIIVNWSVFNIFNKFQKFERKQDF